MTGSLFSGRVIRSAVWIALVAMWCTSRIHIGLAAEPSAQQWTDVDRQQMLQSILLMNQKKYQEALPILLPLYKKSPYKVEEFEANESLKKGKFALPLGVPIEYKVSGLLFNALYWTKQYPKSSAVASASDYHRFKNPLPAIDKFDVGLFEEEKKKGVRFAPAIAVNDVWINPTKEPFLQGDTVFAPLADLANALKLELVPQEDKSLVVLRQKQPPRKIVFKLGSKEVKINDNAKSTLKFAPFNQGTVVMVSAQDFATVLKGKIHWLPEILFMHVVIPTEDMLS